MATLYVAHILFALFVICYFNVCATTHSNLCIVQLCLICSLYIYVLVFVVSYTTLCEILIITMHACIVVGSYQSLYLLFAVGQNATTKVLHFSSVVRINVFPVIYLLLMFLSVCWFRKSFYVFLVVFQDWNFMVCHRSICFINLV